MLLLVRLLTGEPKADFALCVHKLRSLIEEEGAEILVSNQVTGEEYIAVQHHYGVSRDDTRAGLLDVLRSGLVAPLNGRTVLAAIESCRCAGLLDRLIADARFPTGISDHFAPDSVTTLERNTQPASGRACDGRAGGGGA